MARVADAKKLEAFSRRRDEEGDAKLDAYTKELGAWFVVARVRKTLVTVDVLTADRGHEPHDHDELRRERPALTGARSRGPTRSSRMARGGAVAHRQRRAV